MLKNSLRDKIVTYLKTHQQTRVVDLVRELYPVSRVSLHKQLNKLAAERIVKKLGQPPKVFYGLAEEKETMPALNLSPKIKDAIEKSYLYISPAGELLYGLPGFLTWAKSVKQNVPTEKLAQNYVLTLETFEKHKKPQGWIDATFKLTETFKTSYLNKLFYANFYSLPQFGKTKLGTLLLHAKQSQNRELIKQIVQKVRPLIIKIIRLHKIEAVAFIPPSIPRLIQFMSEFSYLLKLNLPQIKLIKVKSGEVIVAQKSLERLEERVLNAQKSIFLEKGEMPFKRILLIDDAVGSGASFNETAKKLKDAASLRKIKPQIFGFAIVGSFKGFEVIREI